MPPSTPNILAVSTLLTIFLSLLIPCSSTSITAPPQYTTGQLRTPRMAIGNYSATFNFSSELAATDHSLCDTDGWAAGEQAYYSGKALMVRGFQGCSYERVATIAQSIGVTAVIFQSRQRIPGKESTYTNGKRAKNITIPLLVMGNQDFNDVRESAIQLTLIAQISSDINPWASFIASPAPVVIQMLGAFLSLLWILAALRGIFFSLKLQGFSHIHGLKVQIARAVLYIEVITNVLRLTLFASDPFLIKSNPPVLSWSAYVSLLIINVPIGFLSSVCFLFMCLLIMVPSRVVFLKAFFVAVTAGILAVNIAACATNAAYRNPSGIDIYAVSFTLNGVEGFILGIALIVCCSKMLAERNRQIRYSPRALKRLAVLGLVESFFLVLGAIGSFMVAWLAAEAEWLDVYTLCVQWIGLLGVSGCQIACFPKGKRLKKIKVIKVVDNSHVAHPAKQIVI